MRNVVMMAGLIAMLWSAGGWADAVLVAEKSAIRFVSVKNASVAEVHHFSNLKGSINQEGRVNVNIPLVDVETNIPVRNERMREMLLEIASFASASIEADVELPALLAMDSGDYTSMNVFFELNLHGKTQMLSSKVSVARLGDELHVTTLAPLVINVASFDLADGVERLREAAGLKNIATAVPVTAILVFKL